MYRCTHIRMYSICTYVCVFTTHMQHSTGTDSVYIRTLVTDVVVQKVGPVQHHAVNPDCMLDEVATAAGRVGQQLNTAKVLYQLCFQAESLKDKQTL